jgi:hypothetical protein
MFKPAWCSYMAIVKRQLKGVWAAEQLNFLKLTQENICVKGSHEIPAP